MSSENNNIVFFNEIFYQFFSILYLFLLILTENPQLSDSQARKDQHTQTQDMKVRKRTL